MSFRKHHPQMEWLGVPGNSFHGLIWKLPVSGQFGFVFEENSEEITWLSLRHRFEKAPFSKGAFHLARKSGNFGLKSNGTVIFLKFRSEVVSTFRDTPLFPFGTERWKFPYHLLNFPVFESLISRRQLREILLQMVSAISFSWFADFGKTLAIIQRSSQSAYSDKW